MARLRIRNSVAVVMRALIATREFTMEQQGIMIEHRVSDFEARLAAMERGVGRWRLATYLLAGALGVGGLMGANGETVAKVLRAREFRLEDESGRLRASLTMRPDGTPGMALFDKEGKVRLSLDLAAEGAPGVHLHDPRGALRGALAVRPDGTPGIALFDDSGAIRASVDVGTDKSSGVHVYDSQGVLRGAMALRPDGSPAVGLFNARGEVAQSIEATTDGAETGAGPEAP
jgi:hypothetical protein